MKKQTKNKTWRKVKLGEVFSEIESGGRPPGGALMINEGIPSIGAEHLDDKGGFDFSNIKYVPEKYFNNSVRGRIKENDVLVVKDGATIGKVSRISKNFPFPQAMINEHVFIIRGKKNLIDQNFLFYKISTREGKETIKNSVGGSAQGGLKKDFLDHWEVYLPNLNEQKRIAEILSTFDDKIELNNKINKTLEEMASAIFKEWFNKNSKFKIQNSKLKGREVKNAEDIFVFEKGIEPGSRYYSETRKDGYIPFYRVRDLDKQGGVDVYIPEKITQGKFCKEEDVLLSLDATVGRVKIGCRGAFSSGIRKVYSRNGFIKNSFIYFWLKTPYVQNTILQHASGTTILHAGNSIQYLKFPFSKEMIAKIQKKVNPLFVKILQTMKENQTLASLRDLLLPKLMSGEIRV